MFEKRKERVGCSPHPWIVGVLFEVVWFGVILFSFVFNRAN